MLCRLPQLLHVLIVVNTPFRVPGALPSVLAVLACLNAAQAPYAACLYFFAKCNETLCVLYQALLTANWPPELDQHMNSCMRLAIGQEGASCIRCILFNVSLCNAASKTIMMTDPSSSASVSGHHDALYTLLLHAGVFPASADDSKMALRW